MTKSRLFGFKKMNASTHAKEVTGVFDVVADHYDLLNDAMSFGLHRLWKQQLLLLCEAQANERWLDLACGSGDIAKLLHQQDCQMVAADPNAQMLEKAKQNLDQSIEIVQCAAEDLPFKDQSFDGVVCAFGLRNFSKPDEALKQIHRVLRPGSKTALLEFSKPASLLSEAHRRYLLEVLPALGESLADDRASYKYLGESILAHPDQEQVATWLADAGFVDPSWVNISGGIVAIHRAWKLL